MDQNPSFIGQVPYYVQEDYEDQGYKYYCQVCRFEASYVELMEHHYASQCKRYFFPAISQMQPCSSTDSEVFSSYNLQETKPILLPYSEDNVYDYSKSKKNLYPSGSVFQAFQKSACYYSPAPADSQTTFALTLPQLSSTGNYFYSYPSISVPYFYFTTPEGTILAPVSAITSNYMSQSQGYDTYIEVEQASTDSPVNSECAADKSSVLEDWVSYSLNRLSLSSSDLECPSSSQDNTYWDAESIEVQHFDPPLPSLIQVASEEYEFYTS